ncbi:MAG: hypothetical protein KGJ93_05040 [Patescibacteria group bacterium]|nr:hypothetical protein [Patescibacteria group bacterium]
MNTDQIVPLGLMFPVFSGIQVDLNATARSMPDGSRQPASLCDHNCTQEVGGYQCPAAFTLNKGAKPNFASGEDLLFRIETGRNGLMLARDAFLRDHFAAYAQTYAIPPAVQPVLANLLKADLCEVNLFGGNPEMHPEVIWLIRKLKALDFRVNLTTTGRRFLTDQTFVNGFVANPPHLLALSADDFDPMRLEELFSIPLDELRRQWKQVSPLRGQEQKFLEGIYAARFVQDQGIRTTVLFNMVLYHDNLNSFYLIFDTLRRYLPKALVNPYPAQDSFAGGNGDLFCAEDIQTFRQLADFFVDETLEGNPNLTKRLQYWLVMKAVLENCGEHYSAASRMIAGHHLWQCYRSDTAPGAGMYLQVGKANPDELVQIGQTNGSVNGYAGCYWNNRTVTGRKPVSSAQQVAAHLLGGMQRLSQETAEPCSGCSMPRLWFNIITTELGLNPGLREPYLRLRKKHAGF